MSMKRNAQRLAPKLVGLHEDAAEREIFAARCAYRYIVMDGLACGRNADVANDTLCLFSDKDGVITNVVVGSKGIYDHPDYLAAKL